MSSHYRIYSKPDPYKSSNPAVWNEKWHYIMSLFTPDYAFNRLEFEALKRPDEIVMMIEEPKAFEKIHPVKEQFLDGEELDDEIPW